jgi:hypothetical protein
MAGAPALIDNAAKRVEQLRDAMNFIQYDQAVLILAEEDRALDQATTTSRSGTNSTWVCSFTLSARAEPSDCAIESKAFTERILRMRGPADSGELSWTDPK